ncbi:MAG: mandelate racemase/muconate lactonizing enzyme family protein [Actinomycetota bacterium]
MEIASAEVIPYSLPFREPYLTARGQLERREMILLRVRSAEGIEGLGEAVPLSLRGGASLAEVEGELRKWAEDPQTPQAGFTLPASCAVQTALLDIEARVQGVPAWKALGASGAQPVECNATLAAGEPIRVAERAQEWVEEGFGTFKLKVGVPKDLAQVAGVRRAVGPGAKLRVDANGAWGPAEAVSRLNVMAGEDLELAEQPCETLEEMAELRRRTEVRLAADESVATELDAQRAVELDACDVATVKLSKIGGPREALAIATAIPVYLSSSLDGPVGIAAAAHLSQALRARGDAGIAHGLATQRLFAETIAARECELHDGFLHLPDGPGLGVEIDDAALERHRL